MSGWIAFLFAALLLGALVIAARRATSVLVVHAEEGRVVGLRGRAPGELLHDLQDVLARSRATGRVELRIEDRGVTVYTRSLDAATEQQIRNVVGRFPAARLKTAPPVRPR